MGFFRKNKKHHNNLNREIEFEEIFLDKLLKEREEEKGVSQRKLETPLERINFIILFLLGVFLFSILLFFTFRLQVTEKEKYVAQALENKFITLHLTSERGIIYDRNMRPLVLNEVSFDLWFSKSELPKDKKENVLNEIARIIEENEEVLKEAIEKNEEEKILLKKDLNHQQLILLETKKERLPGFKIEKRILRNYENLLSLSHILGYLGEISSQQLRQFGDYEVGDYVGKEGVERSYEQVLKERKGEIQIERDAEGKEISRKIIEYPQSGDSLVLSLDFSLQKKVEEALKNILQEIGAEKGAAVALNPQNGEVLASVSWPSFNNNLFARGITSEELQKLNEDERNPQLNRAIGGVYLTGSTIKPLIATAALAEGIVKDTTEIFCPLELCLVNIYTGEGDCFPDWTFHGWTNIKKAIAESVNPFFYTIGGGYTVPSPSSEFFDQRLPLEFDGLGVTKIAKYLRLFGLGEKTKIDLPGEVSGRVPDPAWKEKYFAARTRAQQIWYLGDTYNLSIGQGYLLATPLQMAAAFQAIANQGKIFKPKIAKEILDATGDPKEELGPELIKENLISEEFLRIVKQGMRQAVSSPSGSAFSLSALPVKACAKTGTAQIYPKKEIYHNWITVFAPYESPEIVLTVVIENVEGTRIAAQKAAQEILDWYFSNTL